MADLVRQDASDDRIAQREQLGRDGDQPLLRVVPPVGSGGVMDALLDGQPDEGEVVSSGSSPVSEG